MISIDEAISLSERRANRLWFTSIVWALIMLGVACIFGYSIYGFNETKREITETRKEIDRLRSTASDLVNQLRQTKAKIDFQSDQIYALELLSRKPDQLTQEDKDFLKAHAEAAASQQPDAAAVSSEALLALTNQDYRKANLLYTKAISLNNAFSPAYSGRAEVDHLHQNLQLECDDLTQAIKLERNLRRRSSLLARRAFAQIEVGGSGPMQQAETDVAEAIKTEDRAVRSEAFNTRGFIKLVKKDWEGAEADYRESAKLDPHLEKNSLENIGLIYLARSDWTKAYDSSVAVANMPGSAGGWVWMIMALAAEKLGKTSERKDAVQEFITHDRHPKLTVETDMKFFLPDDLTTLAQTWVK